MRLCSSTSSLDGDFPASEFFRSSKSCTALFTFSSAFTESASFASAFSLAAAASSSARTRSSRARSFSSSVRCRAANQKHGKGDHEQSDKTMQYCIGLIHQHSLAYGVDDRQAQRLSDSRIWSKLFLGFGENGKARQSGIYADEVKASTIQKCRPSDTCTPTDDLGCGTHCSADVFMRDVIDPFDR